MEHIGDSDWHSDHFEPNSFCIMTKKGGVIGLMEKIFGADNSDNSMDDNSAER